MTTSFQEFRDQFFALVETANRIVITSHMSPDDDSIGSVLSMRALLIDKFPSKDIRIIYTGERIERYHVFYDFETIEWVDDVARHLEEVDTLITVDASNWRRFSKQEETLAHIPVRIGLDHHASEPNDYTLLLKDETASSNTELIYRIFFEGNHFSKEIAEYLLLGVLGDTGNFSYVKPTHSQTLELGKLLIEKVGIAIDQFRSRYGGIPKRIIPLLQSLVARTTFATIDGWPSVQYTYLDRSEFTEKAYSDEDMSAASHIYMGQYLPRVEGYGWGFVITPRTDGTCRMSGRSLPNSVNVRMLHESMGIGSGHDRAAGGFFAMAEPDDCATKVLEWMKSNKPVIG